MNERTRLKRLNQQLDMAESEVERLSQEIGATGDADTLAELKRLHTLAQATVAALQAQFEADFQRADAPQADASGAR